MHLYLVTRGTRRYTRRVIEELEDIYFNFVNKITGKKLGAMQFGVREVRTWELVFPETEKKDIKKMIKAVTSKHNNVALHFGPFKKDKYKDGIEQL